MNTVIRSFCKCVCTKCIFISILCGQPLSIRNIDIRNVFDAILVLNIFYYRLNHRFETLPFGLIVQLLPNLDIQCAFSIVHQNPQSKSKFLSIKIHFYSKGHTFKYTSRHCLNLPAFKRNSAAMLSICDMLLW